MYWNHLTQKQVAGSCKCGNERQGLTKCRAFLAQVRTGQLLKKGSSQWSQLVRLARRLRQKAVTKNVGKEFSISTLHCPRTLQSSSSSIISKPKAIFHITWLMGGQRFCFTAFCSGCQMGVTVHTTPRPLYPREVLRYILYSGADKSLARPGRKETSYSDRRF